MELLSLREKAVLETYTFPSHTSTFISSLFPHEERLSQLKEKKMQKEYAEERLKCRGKMSRAEISLFVFSISLSHTGKNTSTDSILVSSTETRSIQVNCDI